MARDTLPRPTGGAPRRWPAWAAVLGLLALAALWLGALAGSSLVSPDEGRYAALSLGMLQNGDWVTPRLNGLLYFEKPPLQYWMGAIAMGVFGAHEFAARLWPALSGLATVGLVGFTAGRLWGAQTGWRALFIATGTTWIVVNSHFLSLDAGLAASLTLVLCAVLISEHARAASPASAGRWMLAAWVGMSLAVLSKGLVGLLIPGAVLVLVSLWRLDFSIWRRLRWWPGLVVSAVIVLPWFLLVSARNPGFASFFFIHEHLQRYLTPVHRREGAWWYFVPFLLLGFLPWTGALPWLVRARRADFATSLLVVWAGFILLFFSVSSSKLPSYILPMFPALALLLARAVDGVPAAVLKRHLLAPVALWAAGLACVPWAGRLAGPATPLAAVESLAHGVMVAALVFIAAAALAWRWLGQGRVTTALAVVGTAQLLAILAVLVSYNPYAQLKSSDAMVQALRPAITATTPVFAVRTYDQTLPFYLGRPVILVEYVDEFEFGQQHEPGRSLPTLEAFAARWQAEPQAAAYLDRDTLAQLRARGLQMRVLFEDPRRLMVVKP